MNGSAPLVVGVSFDIEAAYLLFAVVLLGAVFTAFIRLIGSIINKKEK